MPGLLGDVLPWVFSRADAAKRQLGGLLSDPVGSAQQAMGLLNDNARTQEGLMGQAFQDPQRPFRVTDAGAMQQAATNMLTGPMGFAPAGITAWHGTRHTFDKFDSSKIGAGEGAQAYGHGLYLAEAPEVAKSYVQAGDRSAPVVQNWLAEAADSGYTGQAGVDWAKKQITARLASAQSPRVHQTLSDALSRFEAISSGGNLYKVDLPDDAVARMLDWDKPLSHQPQAVRVAAQDLGLPSNATGKDIYNALAQQARDVAIMRGQNAQTTLGASQAGASADLRGFGIPGIRYLDGGSRATGGGTSNFVVFPGEESILSILERNGQPVR